MSQAPWNIDKLVLASGRCLFEEWFDSLSLQVQVRVDARLDRIKLGNFGDFKPVGEGVFELRFKFGPGYRIYYALAEQSLVLLLVGGDKSSQTGDIKLAKKLWIEYQAQFKEG
jgi:putative addiction module killer protein